MERLICVVPKSLSLSLSIYISLCFTIFCASMLLMEVICISGGLVFGRSLSTRRSSHCCHSTKKSIHSTANHWPVHYTCMYMHYQHAYCHSLSKSTHNPCPLNSIFSSFCHSVCSIFFKSGLVRGSQLCLTESTHTQCCI